MQELHQSINSQIKSGKESYKRISYGNGTLYDVETMHLLSSNLAIYTINSNIKYLTSVEKWAVGLRIL